MSASLSEQLAALGLSVGEPTVPSNVADQIEVLLASSLPWGVNADWPPQLVAVGRDLHETMSSWLVRIETELARSGVKLARTFDTPSVPSGTTYQMGGITYEHKDPCKHHVVEVNASIGVLLCRACKLPVNPIWWIARRTEAIERSEAWNRHLREEKARLAAEVEQLKGEVKKLRQARTRAHESAAKAAAKEAAAVAGIKKKRRR